MRYSSCLVALAGLLIAAVCNQAGRAQVPPGPQGFPGDNAVTTLAQPAAQAPNTSNAATSQAAAQPRPRQATNTPMNRPPIAPQPGINLAARAKQPASNAGPGTLPPPRPPAPAGASETAVLRTELDRTIERLNNMEQQLQQTRQELLNREWRGRPRESLDSDASPTDRISNLETAFYQFRDVLNARSSEPFPSAKLTGFTQLDDYMLSQDAKNKATVGNGQNGVGFRRARVAVVGSVSEFTNYMVEVDFATAGRPSFFDVWGEYENIPVLGSVRAGQFLQPFSVDARSGFRNLPFLERSLPFLAFVPFRRVGVMSSNNTLDERTYWAFSFFRTGGFNNAPLGDSQFATDIGDQGGLSFSTRATYLVWYDEPANGRYFWQVGGSFDYSQMTGNTASGSQPFYQARTAPEFGPIGDGLNTIPATFGPASFAGANFTPPYFVDTGRYLAKDFALYGLETLYQYGAFSFQSEFMATDVLSIAGPIWYTGAYAEVMYRLTGENRQYDRRLGALMNPIPFTNFLPLGRSGIRGWGAWEIAARLSYVDLRNPSKLVASDYISGTNASGNGTLTDTTLGVTWFMNYHTKLQFNWIHAFLNNSAMGFSQGDFFVSRFQVDF